MAEPKYLADLGLGMCFSYALWHCVGICTKVIVESSNGSEVRNNSRYKVTLMSAI